MLSSEDNELLTQVGPGRPMHDYMRQFWTPFLRSERLQAGGAPLKVRLLGVDYAAYRSPGGAVGLASARCPHRCASLTLARNEDEGLRCIFHGWKFDRDGTLIEAPTEPPASFAGLARSVRLEVHPTHEAGGLVWAYLGDASPAPPPPAFEFTCLPADQVDVRIAVLPVNWLQNMESVLDSAHLGVLHRSANELAVAENVRRNVASQNANTAPRLEFEDTDYGFREAALRPAAAGATEVRLRSVAAPFFVFIAGNEGCERPVVISVPVDDGHCLHICVVYNPYRPFHDGEIDRIWFATHPDRDDFSDPAPGPVAWPQDREAMRAGHFSGIVGRHVFYEDFAVLESMGPIVDRRFEHLSLTDATLVRMRRELLKAVRRFSVGEGVWGGHGGPADFARIRTAIFDVAQGDDWRRRDVFAI